MLVKNRPQSDNRRIPMPDRHVRVGHPSCLPALQLGLQGLQFGLQGLQFAKSELKSLQIVSQKLTMPNPAIGKTSKLDYQLGFNIFFHP